MPSLGIASGMSEIMSRRPRHRKNFLGVGDELNYLNDWIRHCLRAKSAPSPGIDEYLGRFGAILAEIGPDDGSIVLHDHWALYHEARGCTSLAIRHREREIEKIDRLFAIGGPVGPVNADYLMEKLELLHRAYLQSGATEQAEIVFERLNAGRDQVPRGG